MRKLFGMAIRRAWAHTVSGGFLRPLDITLCCACVGHWPGAGQFCLRFRCCGDGWGVVRLPGGRVLSVLGDRSFVVVSSAGVLLWWPSIGRELILAGFNCVANWWLEKFLYEVCNTRYHVSLYLWLIGSVLTHCKVLKDYDQDCRCFNLIILQTMLEVE